MQRNTFLRQSTSACMQTACHQCPHCRSCEFPRWNWHPCVLTTKGSLCSACRGGKNNTLTFLCSAEMRLKFSIASSQRGGKRQIWSSMLNGFCETINGSVRHNSWSNDSHSTSYSIINYFTLQRGDSSSPVLAFYEEPPTSPNSACPKLPSFWNELFCFMESRRAQIQFFMHVF